MTQRPASWPNPFENHKGLRQMGDNVVQLPTDAALAAQARSEVGPIMQALADVVNKYKALGLVIIASCGQDAYGRATAGVVNVVKPL